MHWKTLSQLHDEFFATEPHPAEWLNLQQKYECTSLDTSKSKRKLDNWDTAVLLGCPTLEDPTNTLDQLSCRIWVKFSQCRLLQLLVNDEYELGSNGDFNFRGIPISYWFLIVPMISYRYDFVPETSNYHVGVLHFFKTKELHGSSI